MSLQAEINALQGNRYGRVYTPDFLAEWVASELASEIPDIPKPHILDPACGDGELLTAFKRHRPTSILYGVDIDASAIGFCKARFKRKANFVLSDALLPVDGASYIEGWRKLDIKNSYDGIIANPPWGANLLNERHAYSRAGYKLSNGQFDVWELFVELSMSLLKAGGVASFIIPDSIFLPEHQNLRELVQTKYTILSISRLGEGVFQNVFRGTVILQLKNKAPKPSHKIKVRRLNRNKRSNVLAGELSMTEALADSQHIIAQTEFSADEYSRWSIDTRTDEKQWINTIKAKGGNWSANLISGRGVEISKHGKLLKCPSCHHLNSIPRTKDSINCKHCQLENKYSKFEHTKIIELKPNNLSEGWADLAVGEDVDRYVARRSRSIKLFEPGVKYKDAEIYRTKRLVIRKTGVGIKASILEPGTLTNQVVFHYFIEQQSLLPKFYLSYLAGVLNSRIMFAYHLKVNGDDEWRSHPYLTQKVIERLPIPFPTEGTREWDLAKTIASKVDKMYQKRASRIKLDKEIEALVAGLYEFDKAAMCWVGDVISSAQQLEPMRVLSQIPCSEVTPIKEVNDSVIPLHRK